MAKLTRRRFLAYGTGLGCIALGGDSLGRSTLVKVGILGMNERGRGHLDALRKIPYARVTAICDRDPRKTAAAMRCLAPAAFAPEPHTDFRMLLERRDIDLLVINVPPGQRLRAIEAAAVAGKNVLVGQPAAITLEDAFRLRDMASRYAVSVEHLPADVQWDREGFASLLATSHLGTVQRVEIHDVRAASENPPAVPPGDALEVASQIIGGGMPSRAAALRASGAVSPWNWSAEIELEPRGTGRRIGLHVSRQKFPAKLERSITFLAEGTGGSTQAVVESWLDAEDAGAVPIAWARAIASVPLQDRQSAAARTLRTAAACALTEIVNRAQTRGLVDLNSNELLESEGSGERIANA